MKLLVNCLKLMNQTLEKNMCKLPDTVINSEVKDLKERKEQYLNHALEYACKSWNRHLVDKDTPHQADIISILQVFL